MNKKNGKLFFKNLTLAPIEKELINFNLLTLNEKNYLFKYHLEVYSKISKEGEVKFIAQKFLPEISIGDKRVLIINGKVPKHAVLRTPPEGEFIGNLAAGGSASTIELNEQDKIIAQTVADKMLDFGLYIVGLDMIGNFLTEINLTSPTCFRELNDQAGENLAKLFVDELFGH